MIKCEPVISKQVLEQTNLKKKYINMLFTFKEIIFQFSGTTTTRPKKYLHRPGHEELFTFFTMFLSLKKSLTFSRLHFFFPFFSLTFFTFFSNFFPSLFFLHFYHFYPFFIFFFTYFTFFHFFYFFLIFFFNFFSSLFSSHFFSF